MNIQNAVWYILIVGFLFSACASSKQGANKDGMQLNLKKGDSFTVESFIGQDIAQELMGMKQEQKQQTKTTSQYEVLDVMDNGNMKIKHTYKAMMVSSESMAGSFSYDSEKDEEIPDFAQTQAALIGQSYSFVITPKGEVLSVEGGDKLLEAVMSKVADEQKEMAKASLEAEYGEEKLKSDIGGMFSVYPGKAVKVGETWTSNQRKAGGMMVTDLSQEFTLTEIKDDIAYIDITSNLKSAEDAEPMEMMGMTMEYDIKGEQKGKIQVDMKTGWILLNQQEQTAGGTVNISGPQSMSIPLELKSQIIIKTL